MNNFPYFSKLLVVTRKGDIVNTFEFAEAVQRCLVIKNNLVMACKLSMLSFGH
jgi:hypothetical protein